MTTNTLASPTDSIEFCGTSMTPLRRAALEKLFSKISDVAAFPGTAQKILELTSNENVNVEAVRETLETDPALVANLLRRVNSGFYSLPNKVADLKTAVNLLGIREIRNLAMTVFLAKFNEKPSDHGPFKRQSLWNHCVGVGAASRYLAKELKCGSPEEAYVAGLLHDFGFILCDQFLHPHFCKMLDHLQPNQSTPEIENQILTFDHAMLGGYIARKWNFPESAEHAILYHHKPEIYTGPHSETLHVVVLANYLCSQAGILSLGVNNVTAPSAEVVMSLGLDDARLAKLDETVQTTVQNAISSSSV